MILVKENLIFLNLVNHQLLNNEEIDLSHSAPLLYLSVIKLKEHFSGYGLNLFSHPDLFNSVHLFDENGFKTTYGLIFNDLSWMINQNKVKMGSITLLIVAIDISFIYMIGE